MGVGVRGIAAGLGAAALWGVLLEAATWMLLGSGPEIQITRQARLARVLETGAAAASFAIAVALLCRALPPLRWRLAREPTWALSAFGLGACALLTVGFLWSPPEIEAIRLSQDALALRTPQILAGAALAAAIAGLGLFAPPPPWLHRTQAAASVLLLSLLLLPDGRLERAGRPDVFLLTVDTLRADHLGCYGYTLPTSPTIDAFCDEAIVYEQAMAPAAATIPSYTSLMSGTLQDVHGVYTNFEKAPSSIETLAEILRDAGYRTAALLEGSFPGSFANVGQGFDLLIQRGITAAAPAYTPSEGLRSVVRAALSFAGEALRSDMSITTHVSLRWLHSLPDGAPVFAHFYWPYPHDPYTPPRRYLDLVPARDELPEGIRDPVHRYDAEIRYTDLQIEHVLEALREAGRYEDAWIVITSDHGEELGREPIDREVGPGPFFGHSRYLFDASVRVPLIVKPPQETGIAPGRQRAVVSTASLVSTLLLAQDLPAAAALLGPLPGLGGESTDGDASGLAFSLARNPSRSFDRASVRRGPWRLIETRAPTPGLALHRYRDGRESPDQSAEEPEATQELLRLLHAAHPPDNALPGGPAKLSERERRLLEELGYAE